MQAKLNQAVKIFNETKVPSLPEEVLLLQEELHKKYPNTVTIANLIAHNAELLGDFLTLVNTNVTSEKSEIKDAKAAVNVLGLDEIYNLFVSSCLTRLLSQNSSEKSVVLHGAQAGLAAAELAFWVYDVSRSEAYMAGLMQNVGAIYLARFFNQDYEEVFERFLANPISTLDKEEKRFGTSHVYLGTYISKKWNFNPDVYKAILLHHDTAFLLKTVQDQKVRHLTALIMVANFVVAQANGEQYLTQELKEYRDLGLKALDLPENAIKAATAAVSKWGSSLGAAPGGH
ncbi:HDOD domain-containing protein [Thiomicrorhabdus cannonii]|uniref:HDOD domain-containing protein n=1 Tax=Thiomicrorhabdus cannonii TaxID=2748011 RepID=UPI0015C1652A|nr:HDOD domain-containing protein [Thiomicrorhabdus cannonii]